MSRRSAAFRRASGAASTREMSWAAHSGGWPLASKWAAAFAGAIAGEEAVFHRREELDVLQVGPRRARGPAKDTRCPDSHVKDSIVAGVLGGKGAFHFFPGRHHGAVTHSFLHTGIVTPCSTEKAMPASVWCPPFRVFWRHKHPKGRTPNQRQRKNRRCALSPGQVAGTGREQGPIGLYAQNEEKVTKSCCAVVGSGVKKGGRKPVNVAS